MDNLSKEQRTFCMSKIRGKDTKPEMAARHVLTKMGLRYRLHSDKLYGKPDIVISKLKTIFFINGCFWHQHKGCSKAAIPKTNVNYWEKKLNRNIEKQAEDIEALTNAGWKVFIIWECEAKNEEELYKKIEKML